MPAIEIGRVIVKTSGREALNKALIVDIVDQNFVLISGGGISNVKRRKCNIKHLRPLDEMVKLKRGAKEDQVKKAIGSSAFANTFDRPIELDL